MPKPRIAIPIPTSFEPDYNERTWPQYAAAIERSGGEPVSVPLDDPAAAARLAADCDGVLLPGSGADVEPARFGQPRDPNTATADPAREAVDQTLLEAAARDGKPVLAICFGTQMLNVWRGGSLIQHLAGDSVQHRQRNVVEAHPVEVEPGSLLARAAAIEPKGEAARIAVNSSHHQAIGTPGKGLRVVASSPVDGVIEAVEDTTGGQFLLGVQWHPERTYDESPQSKAIFDAFVRDAANSGTRPQ